MAKTKNSTNQILTIPEELVICTQNIKFAYIALRNLFYALNVCSVNAKIKNADFTAQTESILKSYLMCISKNKVSLFKDDFEFNLFADTLTSFDRNMINKNEQIVIFKNALSSTPKIDKHQLLMLFCHICVECSLQLGRTDILTEKTINEVLEQLSQKMLINIAPNLKIFFINEILSIYNGVA